MELLNIENEKWMKTFKLIIKEYFQWKEDKSKKDITIEIKDKLLHSYCNTNAMAELLTHRENHRSFDNLKILIEKYEFIEPLYITTVLLDHLLNLNFFLELAIFGTNQGAHCFFKLLDDLLKKKNYHKDMAAIYYHAISFGFKGELGDNNNKILTYKNKIANLISKEIEGDNLNSKKLLNDDNIIKNIKKMEMIPNISYWLNIIIGLSFIPLIIIYFILKFYFNDAIDLYNEIIQ